MMRWATRMGLVFTAAVIGSALFVSGAEAFPTSGYSIWTVAGNGTECYAAPACGDGGPATQASVSADAGTPVAVDPAGNLYFADGYTNTVRKVDAGTGIVTRVAGNGDFCPGPGFSTPTPPCGDGGPATSAMLNGASALAFDAAGDMYIADTSDSAVRKVNMTTGVITTYAGGRF